MRTYIKKLQSKPEHVRKQIFFGSLVVCMAFVSFVWIGNLGYRFSQKSSQEVKEEIRPFALFGQSISNTYNSISASVGNAKIMSKNLKKEDSGKVIDLIPIEYN